MRRTRFAAAVLLVRVVLALALLPLLAYAATGDGYEGIYHGTAEGTSDDGGGGSTSVVVWVEDQGETAKITIEVAEFGVVVSAEGPVTADGETLTVPISVDSMGVKGDATLTFVKGGQGWLLTATGQGEALGYSGSGSLAAQRVSGIELPPIGEQFGEMISNITGGPSKAKTASAGNAGNVTPPAPAQGEPVSGGYVAPAPGAAPDAAPGGASDPAPDTASDAAADPALDDAADAASEPTPLAPAETEPPLADNNKLMAAALAALVLILEIILA